VFAFASVHSHVIVKWDTGLVVVLVLIMTYAIGLAGELPYFEGCPIWKVRARLVLAAGSSVDSIHVR
jgi:hypothetical protein